jgi:hypothetical protein
LIIHFLIISRFSSANLLISTQALYFIDLIVATNTTKSGFNPHNLHFISKNFSAHKSAQNHASVMTIGDNLSASFVAIKLLHP